MQTHILLYIPSKYDNFFTSFLQVAKHIVRVQKKILKKIHTRTHIVRGLPGSLYTMGLTHENTFSFIVMLLILGTWASKAISRELHEPALVETLHEQWMAHYGRTYADDAEKEMRLGIFKDNLHFVESFNNDSSQTYKLSINSRFADLTNEEFHSHFTGYKLPDHRSRSSGENKPFLYENLTDMPPNVDWRSQGAVTPVKYQGQCGKTIYKHMCATYSGLLVSY